MKKTLVALAVTAFAASASAVTIYENDGTTVESYGSLRLLLDNSGASTKVNGTKTTTKRQHTNLHNDGSRFGFRINHVINEDLYAIGRLELRFDANKGDKADQFGDLSTKRAYVGLGSKTYGELTFGRQLTIGDDIARAGFDNTYGVTKTPLTTSGNSVVRYDYKAIKGLHLGLDYRFVENRDAKGEVAENGLKSGYGVGAIYAFDVAEAQSMSLAAGYTRDNYKTTTAKSHHRDAAMVGVSYTINNLKLALDYGYELEKEGSDKRQAHGIQTGAKYTVTPAIALYGNYVYWNEKEKENSVTTEKTKHHRFMLGTEYKIHKNVLTFVEGKIDRQTTKVVSTGVKTRTTDKVIGVGLRVHW